MRLKPFALPLILLIAFVPNVAAEGSDAGPGPCRTWDITTGPGPTDIDVKLDPDHCIRDFVGGLLEETPYCVHGSEPGCQGLEDLDEQVFDSAWGALREYGCIMGTEPWCH